MRTTSFRHLAFDRNEIQLWAIIYSERCIFLHLCNLGFSILGIIILSFFLLLCVLNFRLVCFRYRLLACVGRSVLPCRFSILLSIP